MDLAILIGYMGGQIRDIFKRWSFGVSAFRFFSV